MEEANRYVSTIRKKLEERIVSSVSDAERKQAIEEAVAAGFRFTPYKTSDGTEVENSVGLRTEKGDYFINEDGKLHAIINKGVTYLFDNDGKVKSIGVTDNGIKKFGNLDPPLSFEELRHYTGHISRETDGQLIIKLKKKKKQTEGRISVEDARKREAKVLNTIRILLNAQQEGKTLNLTDKSGNVVGTLSLQEIKERLQTLLNRYNPQGKA